MQRKAKKVLWNLGVFGITPTKTEMTTEKQLFEDVPPIQNADVPLS